MVLNIGASWDHNRGLLIRLWLPFVLTEPLIGCDGSTACIIVVVLPLTIELSEDTIFSDSDVWCEEDDQVAAGGDVSSEGSKADFAGEGDAGEST